MQQSVSKRVNRARQMGRFFALPVVGAALLLSGVLTLTTSPAISQEGHAHNPTNVWAIARGGQLYDKWWAVLEQEPPKMTPSIPSRNSSGVLHAKRSSSAERNVISARAPMARRKFFCSRSIISGVVRDCTTNTFFIFESYILSKTLRKRMGKRNIPRSESGG